MKKKQVAAVALAAWVLTVTGFMILARSVDLEIYFVLFLIGLLIVVELIDTISATPRYLSHLRYIIAVGVVIFGWIVATKVLEILSQ
jgi:hypothetical protein